MAHYKISASFLNSFLQNAKWNGFVDSLLKKYEPSKYTEWGCYFEDELDKYYHNPEAGFNLPEYHNVNTEFVNFVNDGKKLLTEEVFQRWCVEIGTDTEWQEWCSRVVVVEEDTFTIIGKPDIYSHTQNRIIDLKTAARSPKRDKFDDSVQHPMYIWMTGIENFDYLILSREAPNQIFKRSYSMTVDVAEEIILDAINQVMKYLKEHPALMKLFEMNFTLKEGQAIFRH